MQHLSLDKQSLPFLAPSFVLICFSFMYLLHLVVLAPSISTFELVVFLGLILNRIVCILLLIFYVVGLLTTFNNTVLIVVPEFVNASGCLLGTPCEFW